MARYRGLALRLGMVASANQNTTSTHTYTQNPYNPNRINAHHTQYSHINPYPQFIPTFGAIPNLCTLHVETYHSIIDFTHSSRLMYNNNGYHYVHWFYLYFRLFSAEKHRVLKKVVVVCGLYVYGCGCKILGYEEREREREKAKVGEGEASKHKVFSLNGKCPFFFLNKENAMAA